MKAFPVNCNAISRSISVFHSCTKVNALMNRRNFQHFRGSLKFTFKKCVELQYIKDVLKDEHLYFIPIYELNKLQNELQRMAVITDLWDEKHFKANKRVCIDQIVWNVCDWTLNYLENFSACKRNVMKYQGDGISTILNEVPQLFVSSPQRIIVFILLS